MYKRNYLIAGTVFGIGTLWKTTHHLAADYVYTGQEPAEIDITITQEDIEVQREEFARTQEIDGHPDAVTTDAYLEFTAVHKQVSDYLTGKGFLLMHGAVVAVDGQSYLFTARSGTGKSTHAALWMDRFGDRAMMVNGDKPYLKITDGQVFAYGTPWNGKEHLGANIHLPLKAICILERDSVNHIKRIGSVEAFPMLVQQTYRPEDADLAASSLSVLGDIAARIPLYRLGCNMDPDAARVSFEGMQ